MLSSIQVYLSSLIPSCDLSKPFCLISLTGFTVHASVPSNTFAIYGNGEDKELTELVPGILNQLGPDSLASLRKLAESYQSIQKKEGGGMIPRRKLMTMTTISQISCLARTLRVRWSSARGQRDDGGAKRGEMRKTKDHMCDQTDFRFLVDPIKSGWSSEHRDYYYSSSLLHVRHLVVFLLGTWSNSASIPFIL